MNKIKILITEDNEQLGEIITNQLIKMGYKTVGVATSGIQTIEMTKKYLPDIILMDIMLQGEIDGIETASIILKQFDIPVVFLTGNTNSETIEKAKKIGAYGYLIKPIKKQELQVIIEISLYKHKLDKKIKINEALYRAVVEDQTDLICRYSHNFKLTFINDAYCKYFKTGRDELIGNNIFQFIHKEDKELLLNNIKSLKPDKMLKTTEHKVLLANNEIKWLQRIDRAIFNENFKLIEYQSVSRDITERKKAEELLKFQRDLAINLSGKTDKLENKLKECLEAAIKISDMDTGGIYLLSEDSNYFYLSTSKGISPEFVEKILFIYNNNKYYNFIIKGKPIYTTFKNLLLFSNYKKIDIKGLAVIPLLNDNNIIACLILGSKKLNNIDPLVKHALETFSTHISSLIKNIKAEDNLINEKETLSVTLKSISDGVISTDINGKIKLMNKASEEITEWLFDKAYNKYLYEVFNLKNDNIFTKENFIDNIIKQNDIEHNLINNELITKNNNIKQIEYSASCIKDKNQNLLGIVLAFRDISKKLILEEEIKKSHKLESLGVLAGGIAHDFNNYMTCILGNISLSMSFLSSNEKITKFLSDAEKAVLRSKDLAQQLLTFAKGGIPVKKTADIKDIIDDSASFVIKGSNVQIINNIKNDLYYVDIDTGQINQVMNNIILNAIQAMPDGGIIKIDGENLIISENEQLPLSEGNYIKISIKDQGCGIPENVKDKIFDPYFTLNKDGNGLGLAICYSIIKKHNGYITYESTKGKGSTFYIYLPASDNKNLTAVIKSNKIISGKSKILIMDDDENIRDLLVNMLEYLGYKSDVAKNGHEAIKKYKETYDKKEPFNLVIMDLTIPGDMGGKTAVLEILKIDKKAQVVVTSGYSNDPIMSDYSKYGFVECIVKPYKLETLSIILNKILSREKNVHRTD